jgi:hypothetical protein
MDSRLRGNDGFSERAMIFAVSFPHVFSGNPHKGIWIPICVGMT